MKTGDEKPVEVDCKAGGGSLLSRVQAANPYPLSVMVVLTDRCNLSCPHCYVPRPASGDDLTSVEVIELLDELKEAGTLQVSFSGGEPGTRSDLEEIIEAAVARHFAVSLKTNASAFSPEQVERMRVAGLPELCISLYSDRPEEHDEFVGMRGAWQRTYDAARLFGKLGGWVRVGIVLMGWNADRVVHIERLCEEQGWLYAVDPRIDFRIDRNDAPIRFRATTEVVEQVARESEHYRRIVSYDRNSVPDDSPLCGVGQSVACIQPNGDVWPCVVLPLVIGNVREKPFRELWDSSPMRRRLRAMKWGDAEKCRGCRFSAYCDRCPGTSFLEQGDMSVPTTMDCEFAEMKYRLRMGSRDGSCEGDD